MNKQTITIDLDLFLWLCARKTKEERPSPRLDRIKEYITNNDPDHIMSCREIASQMNVSHTHVWNALKELRNEKALDSEKYNR